MGLSMGIKWAWLLNKDQIIRPKDEPYGPNISHLGLFILPEENFNRKPKYPARKRLPGFNSNQHCELK